MNENFVIDAIARYGDHVKRYELMIPNCFTQHDNEADLFAVRKSGLSDEFEIKVTRSDLLNDKKKIVHVRSWNENSKTEFYEWAQHNKNWDKRKPTPVQKFKYDALTSGDLSCNYFWYVLADGIGGVEDIPDFAGLIIVKECGRIRVIRHPQKLKKDKLTFEERYQIARKIQFRYWRLRAA